ncbi:MAG TPA: exodeoxyribonuclease VII small subunit [Candidatus Binatia bacterium]|nr:exodeoxyribonuclease VII small subunit [Candidatus Binatia bacterium]
MTMDEAAPGADRSGTPEAAPPVDSLGFDAALAELQAVVGRLEEGGQPLEEALALYERGVALQEHLERLLADAELRIRRLVERGGGRVDALEGPGPEENG